MVELRNLTPEPEQLDLIPQKYSLLILLLKVYKYLLVGRNIARGKLQTIRVLQWKVQVKPLSYLFNAWLVIVPKNLV